jgi:hypothetical protein
VKDRALWAISCNIKIKNKIEKKLKYLSQRSEIQEWEEGGGVKTGTSVMGVGTYLQKSVFWFELQFYLCTALPAM